VSARKFGVDRADLVQPVARMPRFVCALATTFSLALFWIKYRVKYLLKVSVLIALFGHHLGLSMAPASTAKSPEKLLKKRTLICLVGLLAFIFLFATCADMPGVI
jgi:hypothetical protein